MHDLARCAVSAGDRVLDGYVAAMADGTMTIGTELRGAGSLRVGDDVEVLVLDEVRGEVRYRGSVARVGPSTMQVAELELRSMLQKRQVARVGIAQMCNGVIESTGGVTRTITFVVLNIGAHGMRIATTARLTERERVVFRFPTGDGTVPLDAEVLRAQRTRSGSTHYGCRFVDLDEKGADALFRFVLQAQAAQRRTRLRT